MMRRKSNTMMMTIMMTTIDEEQLQRTVEGIDLILSHFQQPIFPRKIMTKSIGYQLEVFDKRSVLNYFKSSNYTDCRINAYTSHTNYHGINRVALTFIMIDLDLKDFGYSKEKIDRTLQNTLKKIKQVIGGCPTVLWTGNGYHIYQPMEGFILEEEEVFAKFTGNCDKDLTSRFMQFAEEFFTNRKRDAQHNPTVKSSLLRIPYTLNSKCKGEERTEGEEVTIIQKWDGYRPPINYLLRDFRRYLINERIKDVKRQKQSKNHSQDTSRSNNIIPWIEKLMQTRIEDNRKFAVWRILAPYFINIKKLSYEEAFDIIRDWLNKCGSSRKLDFKPDYLIKYNLNNAKRIRYLPIGLDKLKEENSDLYQIVNN
jgi:hypothetical protein